MIELIISRSPAGVRTPIELRRGESATLGREALADYAFNGDSQMSTVHLTVNAFDRHLEFIDESSTNGTFLNGARAMSGRAVDGDEIRIGQTVLLVRVHQEADVRPPQFVAPPEPIASRFEPRAEHALGKPLDEVLEIEADDGSVRHVEPGGTLSIGRTPRADWVFEHDPLMSSLHCVLAESHGTWEVVDSHSSNGTFVNGRRIEKAVVDDGDEVKAGNSRFRLTKCKRRATEQHHSVETDYHQPVERFTETSVSEAAPEALPAHLQAPEPSHPVQAAPHEPSIEPVQYDALWMFSRQSGVAPICILRGGAITIDSASIAEQNDNGAGRPMPRIAVQWRAHWGEFSASSASPEVRRNGIPSAQGVLVEGDALEIGNVRFDVAYKSVMLMPPESDATVGSPAQPDRAAGPTGSELATAEEAENLNATTLDTAEESPVDDAASAEPAQSDPLQCEDVVNDKPPIASDSVTIAVERLEGCLPGNDLIGALCRLAPHNAAWLLEVDGVSWQCVSLPFKITTDDAAWMLAVQASWPKNNYLIVFSDASADQVFEAISTFQTSQADRKLSSESLAIGWDAAATSCSLLASMQGLMVVEGAASRWRFFGALDRLTAVSKELQSWK